MQITVTKLATILCNHKIKYELSVTYTDEVYETGEYYTFKVKDGSFYIQYIDFNFGSKQSKKKFAFYRDVQEAKNHIYINGIE